MVKRVVMYKMMCFFMFMVVFNGCYMDEKIVHEEALILRYDFSMYNGNKITDLTENRFDGLLQEGAKLESDRVMEDILSLDGEGAYFELPQNILDGVESYTVSMFINVKELTTWARVFDFGSGTEKFNFLTLNGSGGKVMWDTNDTEKIVSANTSDVIIPLNTWLNITCTYANGISIIYLNGYVIAKTTDSSPNLENLWQTTQNYIGKSQFEADPTIKADFADIRIYNMALAQSDVQEIVSGKINTDIVALEDVSITIDVGEVVVLPKLLNGTTKDGNTVQVMVFWDDVPQEELQKDGTINVTGRIGGSDITATAEIHITSLSESENYSITIDISSAVKETDIREITADFTIVRLHSSTDQVELVVELNEDGNIFDSVKETRDIEGEEHVTLKIEVPAEYKDSFYDVNAYAAELQGDIRNSISRIKTERIIPLGVQNKVTPGDVAIDTESLYGISQQTGLEYVLRLDPDRLLAPCYEAVGRKEEAKGVRYGGWEAQQIAGHSLGHYLSALADFSVSTKSVAAAERMTYVISELKHIQREDGFLAGVESTPFDITFTGDFTVEPFGLSGYWVPWYSVHKIYAGLIDAYKIAGNEDALDIVKKMADWAYNGSKDMSDETFQRMLQCEHGGMNEVMADLYAITKDDKYLYMAKRFTQKSIIDPLANKIDILQGLHANTQIPKLIGAARIYELTGDEHYRDAAKFFFETVIRNRSFVIGGNSVGEHFGPSHVEQLSKDSCETCNTYNMMKLTEHVFSWEKNSEYADYYERAFFNHILASQDPQTGAKTYFVSTDPGHFKVYGTEENSFWCCTGTGMENPGRYNRFVYYIENDDLYINMFMPSLLTYAKKGLKIEQKTDFPYADTSVVEILESSGAPVTIKIRVPYWIAGQLTATVDDDVYRADEQGYLSVSKAWQAGDRISIHIPMQLHQYTSMDSHSKIAVMYGPVVLAAELGVDNFPAADIVGDHLSLMAWETINVPGIVTPENDITKWVKPLNDFDLSFEVDSDVVTDYRSIVLKPFYDLHHQRYTIYFNTSGSR